MYTPASEREELTTSCPACRQMGSWGEYGASCDNDRCDVIFYSAN